MVAHRADWFARNTTAAEKAAYERIRQHDTEPPTFPSPDLDELLAEPDPEYDWIVEGLIERGDRTILTGAEGVGKSTLSRQIAVAVASGLHPFTFEPIVPVRTLLVDVENGRRHVKRKLRALRQAAGDEYRGILRIETLTGGLDLTTQTDASRLAKLVDANRAELLVIGPVYKLAMGDPSDEPTARTVAARLDRLRVDFGCALLLEAHSPHSQNGTRAQRPYGASLWMRWPEFGIHLDANGKLAHWRGPRDEREWPRRLVRSEPWPFAVADDAPAPDGTFRPTCLMERASRRLEALTASGTQPTKSALAGETTGKRAAVMLAVDMLVVDGFAALDGAKHLRSVKPYREATP